VAEDLATCEGDLVPDLTASGENIRWYADPELTILLHTGNSYSSGMTLPGSYTYYVTQALLDCESPPDSVSLTINALPDEPVVENAVICEGDSVPDLTVFGDNIRWYADPGLSNLIHSGNNYNTGETLPGNYTYYVTQTLLNCESPPDSVSLTINILPNEPFVEDVKACEGNEIPPLRAIGENIKWYSDADLINLIFEGNDFETGNTLAGVYQYFVTQTIRNCISPLNTVYLSIYSLPEVNIGNDTTIYTNESIILHVENPDYTYLWSTGSEQPEIEIFGTATGPGDHPFWVIVTDSNSCSNSDTIIISVILFTDVQYLSSNESIWLYPNPVSNIITLEYNLVTIDEFEIKLFDNLGRAVYKEKHKPFIKHNVFEIDVSHLPEGYYRLIITNSRFSKTIGLIKQ
jgi:hypothetical protein